MLISHKLGKDHMNFMQHVLWPLIFQSSRSPLARISDGGKLNPSYFQLKFVMGFMKAILSSLTKN